MSESNPKVSARPRWIVHSDGRVTEFEPSQLAADLYRARCSHKREGAALFAAELSTAVMHFARREFASPVWRADRLKNRTAELLRELGHDETAEAWLHRPDQVGADERLLAYSPDLVGLVEEGVLDFDLRLDDARLALKVVDATAFAGTANSAGEFLEQVRHSLANAANAAERILVTGLCLGAALLHRASETPEDVAAEIVAMIVESMASTLTPTAIDLRSAGDVVKRLSCGPLFPFDAPLDWKEFHAAVVGAIPKAIAQIKERVPLCVVTSMSLALPVSPWRSQWNILGADRRASLLIGLAEEANEIQRSVEMICNLPTQDGRMGLGRRELGILSSVVRAAVQRTAVLRQEGKFNHLAPNEAAVFLAGWQPPGFQIECRRLLEEFARPFGISLRYTPPCRAWWGDDFPKFCQDLSESSDARESDHELWRLRPGGPRSTFFLIPRRETA